MATYSLTLTGTWGAGTGNTDCYVEINSVRYDSAQVIEVQSGTVVKVVNKSYSTGYHVDIYMDGSVVASSDGNNLYAEYEFTFDSPCTISTKTTSVPGVYTLYTVYIVKEAPPKNHKTLIGGTGYEITSGRTLVDGTGYDIKKGRTLIGGTGYDIPFANTVNIKTRGVSDYSRLGYWIEVDGERIYKTGEYKIRAGSTLRFFTSNKGSAQPSTTDANDVVIYLNGTKVKQTYFGSLSVDANDYGYSTVYLHYYDYILENDITVSKTSSGYNSSAKLYIVEE